ncbi:hypothetical protein EUS_09850 [[Eubacterium] siraeum 70/3]|uniref:Uncharacterized protein n=1 Tax=[Eubacterium] siraeum 70/3 TaxID=657319 RepID=D4JSX7_9FIRM|nr:hypothetical protein EUS_09850 [[Eubacterium] siraeum 70/3]
MRIEKMLAALLAGLITLSLAGCAADKANDNTESGAVSTESSITATETDKASEPTAESGLPAGTESTAESTAEKEKESSTAPADSGKPETAKPADTESPTVPPKQTEPPKVTEPPESKPTESPKSVDPTPTETEKPKPADSQFDINYWIEFARKYAENIGLAINPEAVSCWDNPIIAGPNSKYLERDIKTRMNRYKNVEGFTDIWVWAESDGNGNYRLFIGYA